MKFPIMQAPEPPRTLWEWLRRHEDDILRPVVLACFGIVLVLTVAGCATEPYWKLTHAPVPCFGPVRHGTDESLRRVCRYSGNRTLNGCVIRMADYGVIHLSVNANECTLRHERAHCEGWTHDNRVTFVEDCGPK